MTRLSIMYRLSILNRLRDFPALLLVVSLALTLATLPLRAQDTEAHVKPGTHDNGRMWTFDYPPLQYFSEAYDFSPDREWLNDTRLAALRFSNYCSASFVSGSGLVMTNYHCGLDPVEQVTREGEDLRKNGFYARTLEEERKVEGLFVEQLVDMIDVTGEIHDAVAAVNDVEQHANIRSEKITEIETRFNDQTGLRCEVVSFFNGGLYSAYMYKRYDDVRLVLSSELNFAFFGGIYDFWTYPRYSFDCDFFRVYENDKPLKTEHFFRWSKAGPAPGEAVFVVGNPGRTGRLATSVELEFSRDVRAPFVYRLLNDRVEILSDYVRKYPDRQPDLFHTIFSMVNGQEAYKGRLAGLRDDRLMQRRKAFDREFRNAVESDPALKQKYGEVWDEIESAVLRRREVAPDALALRSAGLGISEHYAKAAALVTYGEQLSLPESEREKAYSGNDLVARKSMLEKPVAADPDLEPPTLARQLSMMSDLLDSDDEILNIALKGSEPDQAAKRMLSESVLGNANALEALVAGAPQSIEQSDDPFIAIARIAVPRNREASAENGRLARIVSASRPLLGRALYEVYGTDIPPDATFTLRISDGVVEGYEYNGTKAPPFTTYFGMYNRYYAFRGSKEAWDPMMNGNAWDLPERWLDPPPEFDLGTPLNFVSTMDIIGGNSGSPVINREREIVGLAFDGNIESLPGEFIFAEDAGNRTISVHSAGILAALKYIYKAERIVKEILGGDTISE